MTKASDRRKEHRNRPFILRLARAGEALEIVKPDGTAVQPGDLVTGQMIRVDLSPPKPDAKPQ